MVNYIFSQHSTGNFIALHPLGQLSRSHRFLRLRRLRIAIWRTENEICDYLVGVTVSQSGFTQNYSIYEIVRWSNEAVLHINALIIPKDYLKVKYKISSICDVQYKMKIKKKSKCTIINTIISTLKTKRIINKNSVCVWKFVWSVSNALTT